MEKWEYQFVIAEKHGKGIFGFLLPQEISWKVHYINGRQIPNWRDMIMYSYIMKMGDQGWELLSVVPHISIRTGTLPVEHLMLVFKRRKEPSSSGA
jgi:hypothetical protein